MGLLVIELVLLDVTLTLEDGDDVALNLGIRNEELGLLHADSVADAGE